MTSKDLERQQPQNLADLYDQCEVCCVDILDGDKVCGDCIPWNDYEDDDRSRESARYDLGDW